MNIIIIIIIIIIVIIIIITIIILIFFLQVYAEGHTRSRFRDPLNDSSLWQENEPGNQPLLEIYLPSFSGGSINKVLLPKKITICPKICDNPLDYLNLHTLLERSGKNTLLFFIFSFTLGPS